METKNSERFKFRAWDKKHKIMYDRNELSLDSEEVWISDWDQRRTYSQIDLMQYTWLKDKNWKDIYEGDMLSWKWIVGFWKYRRQDFSCQDRQVRHIWRYIKKWNKYDSLENFFYRLRPRLKIERVDDFVEVIWNVREHPNLLNKED